MHVIRSCIELATACNLSIAVIFIHLTKAFDIIIREAPVGWPTFAFGSKRGCLPSLGVPDEYIDSCINQIASAGPILNTIGVPDNIVKLLASLHCKSWLVVGEETKYVIAKKGGRHGCRFGGELFDIIYDKALIDIRQQLAEHTISSAYTGRPQDAVWAPKVANAKSVNASDKTFVNDEAIVITDVAASDLVEKVHFATCIVANFFHGYDMVLNFCKEKTECIVKLRGLGSRSVKERLAYCLDPDGVRVSVVPDVGVFGDVRLRIVDSYKHLGSRVFR